jgi:hypothetical protein
VLFARRPHLTSACFFVLGIGTLLPWSSSVVTLPWLAAAARNPPVPPPELSDALLGAITLAFSLTNTLTVFTVARAGLAARLPPAAQVPAPLLACALTAALAALAAHADAGGSPLSGRTVVSFALPAAVVQGLLTALLNCGGAAMAAPMPPRIMRAYTSGQALAGLAASTGAFLAAAAVAPGQSKHPDENDAEALAAMARHASWAFAATSVLLTLCLGAYITLRRMAAKPQQPSHQDADGFASAATEPLLGDAAQADEAGALDEPASADAEAAEGDAAPLVPHNGSEDDAKELRLYKLVRASAPLLLSCAPCSPLRIIDAQCVFLTYIVSLCVYPDITAWLRPAAQRGGGGGDALLPFGVRLRGDLLVPFSFVVFNAVRLAKQQLVLAWRLCPSMFLTSDI